MEKAIINYEIYQIDRSKGNTRDIKEFIDTEDQVIDFSIYENIYKGLIKTNKENTASILEDLFYIFNMERPSDFKGRSLSVGDVVKLDNKYFYCQSFGWKEINIK